MFEDVKPGTGKLAGGVVVGWRGYLEAQDVG